MRVLRTGHPALSIALATFTLLSLFASTACARQSPTAADPIELGVASSTALSAANSSGPDTRTTTAESSSHVRLFSTTVAGGTLRLTAENGDVLTGTYTGQVTTTARSSDASLDLQITGGSGQFQGASGTLRADGSGAFAGEGTFTLVLKGLLRLPGKPGASHLRVDVDGVSFVSCLNERTWVALAADGDSNRNGHVRATLRHQVTNSSCAS